jgi:hypothetical protein
MQSEIEQHLNSVHYVHTVNSGDHPTIESQGELEGDFQCKLRGTI